MITQISIAGTNLIDRDNGYFVTTPLTGLDAPVTSSTQYANAGESGVYVPSIFLRERRISLKGVLRAACHEDLQTMRSVISSLIIPVRSGKNLTTKAMIVTTSQGYVYQINVQVLGVQMPISDINSCEYLLDIICEDPRIYSYSAKNGTVTQSSEGSLSFPVELPFSFSGGVDGAAVLTNSGSVDSLPVITMYGPLTNPRITNTTTGEYMQINATILAGNIVTIDVPKKTILFNSSTNYMSKLTEGSSWISVAPGLNEFVLSTSVAGQSGYVYLVFYDAYLSL